MTGPQPGQPAIVGGGLVTVLRRSRRGAAEGYIIMRPGAAYSEFAPDWTVKPAVVGGNVCVWARHFHHCGRVHLSIEQARAVGLTVSEQCGACGGHPTLPHGLGVCV